MKGILLWVLEILWTRAHSVIHELEWWLESSQNCTNRRRVQFGNFQNITSDLKSRNSRASSHDFLIIAYSTNYAFFDILKFSLKERFRGQRPRKVDYMQIFFIIILKCFYCFCPHCLTIKPIIWYFENGLYSVFTHVISNLVFSTERKENVCMIIVLNSRRISWVPQHGRRSIVSALRVDY